jgi:ferredoxin
MTLSAMAKIIIDNIEYEVPDGQQVAQACETAGIPFSCNSGVCGTCQIEILEGADNLGELNREEQELAMDRNHRLGCQCVIKSGVVKVTY